MMRVAICAGHGLKAQGGRMVCDPGAVYHGEKEHPACRKIMEMVKYLCEDVEHVELLPVRESTLQAKVAKINDLSPDYAVEIHLNAASDPSVRGAEALYFPGSSRGIVLAERFASHLSHTLHTPNRGALPRKDLFFLRRTRCPAIITEAAFLSNPLFAGAISGGFALQCVAFGHARAIMREAGSL